MSRTFTASPLLIAILFLVSACGAGEGLDPLVETAEHPLISTVALRPTSDVAKSNVTGIGDATNLFRNIDDGTSFSSTDDSATYVRCTSSTCTHRVGYSGAPAGTVTSVVVNYRVRRASATGTAQVRLYSGNTLVRTGPLRTTSESWANFTDTYTGLSLPDANNLRTEMVMKRTSGGGNLRHTLGWIAVTTDRDTTPPTVSLTAPTSSTVRGSVVVSASAADDRAIARVDFLVDGVLRASDASSPYSFVWRTFHETFGDHPQGVHTLRAVAYDAAGNSAASQAARFVLPAFPGDCNQDGVVNSADVGAITSEVGDGDGSAPEGTPGGSFPGNPACDANEDNVVDAADQNCAHLLATQGPGACFAATDPLVVPLIFVPSDRTAEITASVRDFVRYKIEETKRFYAKNNQSRTFRAQPLEVVSGNGTQASYWATGNFEAAILEELQGRGYPVHLDWARFPSDRVTWVLAIGGGGWAGGRHYPTGGGFSMWGDALLYAGMDLDCSRVRPATPDDGIVATCEGWRTSGNIYGFGIGAAIHELGHGFNLPHPPEGSPDWPITVMGYHWNYPRTGLGNLDRSILAISHMFPGFVDPVGPTVTLLTPTEGAVVSGTYPVTGGASDNDGIRSLRVSIDGVVVPGLGVYTPFQDDWGALGIDYQWDTRTVADGPHTVALHAEDTAGNVVTRTINLSVQNGGPSYLWLEAEAASSSSPMLRQTDTAASGGQYVRVAAGSNSTSAPPATGRAALTFTVASPGSYKVWGRVIAPTTSDDSFWVRMDGGTWIKWNEIALGSTWHWDEVHDADNGNQVAGFALAAGSHTLEIAYREDGTRLDRLLVTNDPGFVPTGTGP